MMLKDKVVITGGTGFLGRGLLERARLEDWPCDITVLSRDETKQDECRRKYPFAHYVLGDVCNYGGLYRLFEGANTVIHTAAIKYVPDAEFNVEECIRVNVDGLRNVINAANHQNVDNVVFISTDKAVQPVNVYGMTKALGERLISEAARWSQHTKFTYTRYGNVIYSTGSVVPLFERQLREKGQVTVTDPSMTRFWLTIDEAVDLVLEAVGFDNGYGIIPKARAMSIGAIATAIAGDNVVVTGVRPGEKQHEDLVHLQESVRAHDCGSKLYYFMSPVWGLVTNNLPFTYSSNKPYEWLSETDLLDAISHARLV